MTALGVKRTLPTALIKAVIIPENYRIV